MSKFYIQGKIAPNVWVRMSEISLALIDFDDHFDLLEDANRAKGKVKNYLKVYEPSNKVPIRVLENY